MAYVRQRGNQLAIVHGIRDPETKQVSQQILFTLYSRPEAIAAIGNHSGAPLRHILHERHPQLKLDWKQLRAGVEAHLHLLPDSWDYAAGKVRGEFHADLARFARQLVLSDPGKLASSPALLDAWRLKLGYLKELIELRLNQPPVPRRRLKEDEFGWHAAFLDREVPSGIEERAADAYERNDYPRATAAFTVLTEAFPDYAEGHNYLGLISLARQQPEEAVGHFRRTMEVGRRLFPRRIARSRWWNDLATRPYLRGLRNLALALNQAGRWDEALGACEQLERECGDSITAAAHRATAELNLGHWQPALEAAHHNQRIDPGASLLAAFAAHPLGRLDEARGWFLHAALNQPRTVAMVLGAKLPALPRSPSFLEVQDHNGGLTERRSLAGFLKRQSPASRRFFLELWNSEQLKRLRAELAEMTRRWAVRSKELDRPAFERMTQMQTFAFATATMGPPPPLSESPPKGRRRPTSDTVH